MEKIATPGKTRCEDVATQFGIDLSSMVKAIALMHEKQHEKQFVHERVQPECELCELCQLWPAAAACCSACTAPAYF